jgi:gamma-glutamylcyclotransferase (GGCT)/AIG2-like uncharacterized protein YtfP
VHWLFVYGTLMPGRLRWPHVAGVVAERRPAAVQGTLYDTGRGYPALVLASNNGAGAGGANGNGPGRVEGWLLGFPADAAGAIMDRLDTVEGPSYRQSPVTATDGTAAVTYVWVGPVPGGFTALPGRWGLAHEDER